VHPLPPNLLQIKAKMDIHFYGHRKGEARLSFAFFFSGISRLKGPSAK
jgi:hypothetical protein